MMMSIKFWKKKYHRRRFQPTGFLLNILRAKKCWQREYIFFLHLASLKLVVVPHNFDSSVLRVAHAPYLYGLLHIYVLHGMRVIIKGK